jgi:hypothetical protein
VRHTELLNLVAKAPPNETEGRTTSYGNRGTAPDEIAQEILGQGCHVASPTTLSALHFDKLVECCSDYAEGYNQRAFINFIREDYAAAPPDLERASMINHRRSRWSRNDTIAAGT